MIFDPDQQSFKDNYKLMTGSILPRPIAFISTISKDGVLNLAPFSFFNGVCSDPPTIMFAPGRRSYDGKIKDTLRNIRDTEEFVVNIVSENFANQMVICATDYDPEINEFEISGLTAVSGIKIKPPRVAEAKISFECVLNQIIEVGDKNPGSGFVVLGRIVLFHVADDVINERRIDLRKLKPVGRLAGNYYTRPETIFKIVRKIRPD
ncbi:MAG: flavin reductase family protein [Fidelibacterota bacterium]